MTSTSRTPSNSPAAEAGMRVMDFVIGILVAVLLTGINLWFGLESGMATFLPYDPIGAVMLAQSLLANPISVMAAPFTQTSGLWAAMIAVLLNVVGDALWVPYLMIFWPAALMLTIASWVGRVYLGTTGMVLFVVATALIPLIGHGIVSPLRDVLSVVGVDRLFWSSLGSENSWQCWSCGLLKTDYLAGAFVAASISILAISPERVGFVRFVVSGGAICLAILTKGHFALVYLAGWGGAIFTIAMLLGGRGPTFALRSYWALVVALIPILGAWWALGAADFAVAYIRSSFLHPLHGSDAYLKPEIGMLSYIMNTGLASIGFGFQVLVVVSILALVVGRARLGPPLKAALPFFVAAAAMAAPYLVNPFGKNFTMVVPLHLTFWVGLLVLCGGLMANWAASRARSYTLRVAITLFAVFGVLGTFAAIAAFPGEERADDLAQDRRTLEQVAEAIVTSRARTVLTPLAHTGIPAILIFESTKFARQNGGRVPTLLNTNWNTEGGEAARAAARRYMETFDAILVVPGGPDLFSFLGAYQAHVYRLTESVVTAPESPFVVFKTFIVEPTEAPFLYFPPGNKKMEIKLYVRRELAKAL